MLGYSGFLNAQTTETYINTGSKKNNNNRKLKARANISPIIDHYTRNGEIQDIDPKSSVLC